VKPRTVLICRRKRLKSHHKIVTTTLRLERILWRVKQDPLTFEVQGKIFLHNSLSLILRSAALCLLHFCIAGAGLSCSRSSIMAFVSFYKTQLMSFWDRGLLKRKDCTNSTLLLRGLRVLHIRSKIYFQTLAFDFSVHKSSLHYWKLKSPWTFFPLLSSSSTQIVRSTLLQIEQQHRNEHKLTDFMISSTYRCIGRIICAASIILLQIALSQSLVKVPLALWYCRSWL
jgi:hypothetical protein